MKPNAILKKKPKKKRSQLPIRLNILFAFVFLIFSLLIVQLGIVQILNGEEAQREINETANTPTEKAVPRGKMYDSNHDLILDNEPVKAITYTPPKNGESAEDLLKLAEELAAYITIIKDEEELTESISERDKKEYWYLENRDTVAERLTKEEKALDSSEQYKVELKKITQEDLDKVDWNADLLNIIAIKKELAAAYELSPHIVVNEGLTDEEYAKVAENLYHLEGINAMIDWERKNMYENTISSFIGGISTSEQGIPRDNSQFYLSNGYTRNDRVGESGLEQEYEHVLRGRKEKVNYTTDADGNVISSEVVVEGQRGKDLVLTTDMEFQQEVDKIVKEELETAIHNPASNNGYLKDALAVVMNPQTGDILAMSGFRYDRETNEFMNQAYRTVYDAHEPGSSIKGATLLAGYQEGVVGIGSTLVDAPIKIKGSPSFSSHGSAMGAISDLVALERSSNVYMAKVAIKIGNGVYRQNEPLNINEPETFNKLRNYYSQFGLGVETGIDLPYEATGLTGEPSTENLMHLAIGQYDTYTTLQLAQYVSTIANDGYRMKPRLVKEIREPSGEESAPGKIIQSFEPEVLNRVEMDQKYIERVQEGFRRVYAGSRGTASGQWSGFPYEMAGKTGTAEKPIVDNGVETYTDNLALIGYTPLDEPKVAFAIMVPENGTGSGRHQIHHAIGKRIIKTYYEMKDNQQTEEEE
ncbi:penicillin-binding protein 2 [Gracilibacillus caseinilyticus]|uniref:serine-type D-Ala-D-Ala carboxypeptidase n=1 Tax=Gracilibacillus caseinilyticus TaxID=2932256 RepID=A0ABY4ETL0_9BACI|nr:penicillin-binding protein 2 [Gracilibacillus caseinilyticus]UOQ47670.1 penicillin-binding protein 2 [Gracilibacillus caseinilyticus]